jgi:Xaa-Pro dipeptidase
LNLKRRNFIHLSTLVAGAAVTAGFQSGKKNENLELEKLVSQTSDIVPISLDERRQRVAKAQQLLLQNKMDALVIESGTSLEYFTGISWWPSERTLVAVIPSKGELIYICPGFEEPRFRELITIGQKVIVWQEDESPYSKIVAAFNEIGTNNGKIGIEEELRFFIYDGIRKLSPHLEYVSGDPITVPCRMIKSAAEIALMQKATDITIAAMTLGMKNLKEGVSPGEISAIVSKAHREMGATPDFALILFGTASALPHGSIKPQLLKKGDIVLMDCGCRVEGYSSDITRTIVFGAKPTQRQQDIWNLEQKSQLAGFSAARIGAACEQVDIAARKVITDAGLGPGYKLPGLPHRTGHGIGMDGHEWAYMVKGDKQLLQPGMCFSIEPTIAIPGEFGVRLEDCVYMTADGPKWFSQPAISIDSPFVFTYATE